MAEYDDNFSDEVVVKHTKRKRKRPDTSVKDGGRAKVRRSGRKKQPPPPASKYVDPESEDFDDEMIDGEEKKARKALGLSTSPEPLDRMSSPEGMPPPPSPPQQHYDDDLMGGMDEFDILEQELQSEQDKSQRQAREIEELKQQLKEKDRKLSRAHTAPAAKRGKAVDEKDKEIEELTTQLKRARDMRSASRMALEHCNKGFEELKRKHKRLNKAAKGMRNQIRELTDDLK